MHTEKHRDQTVGLIRFATRKLKYDICHRLSGKSQQCYEPETVEGLVDFATEEALLSLSFDFFSQPQQRETT